MKQRDWMIIMAGVIAIYNIFFFRASIIKEHRHYLVKNNSQKERVDQDEGVIWVGKIRDDPIAFFTLISTFATIGLYFATRSLWISTDRLVVDAAANARLQLRAYVGIEEAVVTEAGLHDQVPATVVVTIKNYGATPALRLVPDLEWFRFVDDAGQRETFAFVSEVGTVLMPGSTREITLTREDDIAALPNLMRMYGSIVYDTMGKRERTDVAMFLEEGRRRFQFAPAGNSST